MSISSSLWGSRCLTSRKVSGSELKYGVETHGKGTGEQGSGGAEAQESSRLRLIPLARKINDEMPSHMVALIEDALSEAGRELAGAKVALLGVAYLENSDDTRNTPAAVLARLLLAGGAEMVAHDPHARESEWRMAKGSIGMGARGGVKGGGLRGGGDEAPRVFRA
jgi:hypothetical protein